MTRCTAKDGGGIAISEGAPGIQRMVFAGNSAQLSGGAINIEASDTNATAIEVRLVLIASGTLSAGTDLQNQREHSESRTGNNEQGDLHLCGLCSRPCIASR